MKYCLDEQDKSITIKRFKIIGDSIVITFLDDSTYTLELNDKNLHNLIDLMIKQAEYRNNFSDIHDTNVSTFLSGYLTLVSLCVTIFTSLGFMEYALTDNRAKYIYGAASTIFAILTGLGFKSTYNCEDKSDELEKYRIYLKLAQDYLIDIYNDEVNINTIDDYSLKDIEKYQKSIYKKTLGFKK